MILDRFVDDFSPLSIFKKLVETLFCGKTTHGSKKIVFELTQDNINSSM